MKKDFEIVPHTAELQIRVYGKTMKDLFRNALIGMFQSLNPQAPGCRLVNNRTVCDHLSQQREVKVHAIDKNALLIDFLSEALYLSDINNEAYLDVNIHAITDKNMEATLFGIKVDRLEGVEIKAVTYHAVNIKQVDGIWQTDIVFDI